MTCVSAPTWASGHTPQAPGDRKGLEGPHSRGRGEATLPPTHLLQGDGLGTQDLALTGGDRPPQTPAVCMGWVPSMVTVGLLT